MKPCSMEQAASYSKTVAVDLDGTILDFSLKTYKDISTFGKIDQGMVDALRRVRAQGWRIIIHSCRVTPFVYAQEGYTEEQAITFLTTFLEKNDIPFDMIWTKPGKPLASFYVDDRAVSPEAFKEYFKATELSVQRHSRSTSKRPRGNTDESA